MLTQIRNLIERWFFIVKKQFVEESLKADSVRNGIQYEVANHDPEKWGRVTLPKDSGLDQYYFDMGRSIQAYMLHMEQQSPNDRTLPCYTVVESGEVRDIEWRLLKRFRGPFRMERMFWSIRKTANWVESELKGRSV